MLELHFERKCFYCDLTVRAIRSSRSPEAFQQTAIASHSAICKLYIGNLDGSNLKLIQFKLLI